MGERMEKAIIIGVNTTNAKEHNYGMEELNNLCIACEIEVLDIISQNLDAVNPATYIGKGKLAEIKESIKNKNIDVAIFNDELTPAQIKNINKILDINVYDRTYIILEIFKRRAKTKEAILQVEIASLNYLLPRLIGMHPDFSKQRGVSASSMHGRGQGETQLELDRRYVSNRIVALKKELANLTKDRLIQRKKRKNSGIPIISLVGYTNSGKSTTLNTILQFSVADKKEVLAKDMLFATLETSSRLVKLKNNHKFILTDTVGFINKLPHHLVEAFKSTLEEVKESDLILHIVDATNSEYEEQINITNHVLEELGVNNIPTIYVFNKIDLLNEHFFISPKYENNIKIEL